MPETVRIWLRRLVAVALVATLASMVLQAATGGSAMPTGHRTDDFMAVLDDGSRFTLHAQPTVLTFWASWCAPCRAEAPILNGLHAQGATVVGVSLDPDDMPGVIEKAREMGIRYRVLAGRQDLVRRFKIHAVPSTFVIAADGTVVFARAGVADAKQLQEALANAEAP